MTSTARNVLLGATLLGGLGGVVGCFALLRRQSLLGDALAHAALPGVCLAFLLTGSKHPAILFAGALVAGLVGALGILGIVRGSRVKEDSAIGIVLSVFFGTGIALLTFIQKLPAGNQSGLDRFLFGQAATIVVGDLVLMAILAVVVLSVLLVRFKDFKLVTFDREFAASLGLPVRRLELLLTLLLVLVVVVGLRIVGVVLMVATLITPAAAARQWTDRLSTMLWVAAIFGGVTGAFGALMSSTFDRLPTGPTIVLSASVVLVASLLFAPNRGILGALLREGRLARRIRQENLLKDLWVAGERSGTLGQGATAVSWPHLMGLRGQSRRALERSLRPLEREAWVDEGALGVTLTRNGERAGAAIVRKHRLWETYLANRLELPADHVHRDAEDMEHVLSSDAVERLDELLGHPEVDPHGQVIPRTVSSSPAVGAVGVA